MLTSLRDNLTRTRTGTSPCTSDPNPRETGVPWLQTNPGAQWFTYFRIYGPGIPAFDGSWKPSDFHRR